MIDEREIVRRAAETLTPPEPSFDRLMHRRDRVQRNRRVRAGVLGIAVAIAVGWWAIDAIRNAPIPADHDRSEELGIFAPVAGRIVFQNRGVDRGYDAGLWAVDTSAPSVSTMVRLGDEGEFPLGWTSDGTELLLSRERALFILNADGSEAQLKTDRRYIEGAAISPDGSRVIFAAGGPDLSDPDDPKFEPGLFVVDTDGGQPVPIPYPAAGDPVSSPSFSPDGMQIAYLVTGTDADPFDVWVADADGSDAHEILADEPAVDDGASTLVWSPAGDRIAMDNAREGFTEIHTFAPDGSNFRTVITGGINPVWSPDGSEIAYMVPYDPPPGVGPSGLAIADADGSNVRELGFGMSGPWHPGTSAPSPETTPALVDSSVRADGEVLRFTGGSNGEPGDLVAVHPDTGVERVLVEGLVAVNAAHWSADGRWVAYEVPEADGVELWVVGASQEPRRVATGASILTWSRAGATLAAIRLTSSFNTDIARSTLSTIDPVTGDETAVGAIPEGVGDVTSAPAWSPDLSHVVFGARGGAIYSIDARGGARSLLVRLPGEQLDSVDQIAWSPNGTHIAVAIGAGVGGGLLYVMNDDGSHLRVLLEDYPASSVAWSPDGTRLAYRDQSGTIWVAPMDGSDPTEVGSPLPGSGGDTLFSDSDLVWSPDGSRIGFREIRSLTDGGRAVDVSALDAHGRGVAEPIDEITFASWAGGSYDCGCV